MTYAKVRDSSTDLVYIMLESRLGAVFKLSKKDAKKKDAKAPYTVLKTYKVIVWFENHSNQELFQFSILFHDK